jgi:antitoxin YefM
MGHGSIVSAIHRRGFSCTILLSNSSESRMTIETTYSQAREQFKALMDRAVDDREVVIVRRRAGGAVAMIAADELESLMETAHLLRSPANAERLLTAVARARAGLGTAATVNELAQQLGLED